MALAALTAALAAGGADAAIIKGSLAFVGNAFADEARILPPGGAIPHGAATVEAAVTGPLLSSYIDAFDMGEILEVTFTDNAVVNGPGNDLVVFEALAVNLFRVAVYASGEAAPSAYRSYVPVAQGIIDGMPMNTALIDLSDYGLPPDAEVTRLLVQSEDQNGTEIAGLGALNSVPEPASALLIGLGAVSLLARRRTRPV